MNDSKGGGITFAGLLTVAFVVLKLCKVIDWPWVWVLAPIWMPIGLWLLAVLIAFILAMLKDRKERTVKWNESD